ncbi:hypothetical protein [Pseudovibrio sp. Tun.PSC04-5.I4]|uniref:beta strand repeat-containing protein n=1 Tax=Pseudovibrio sp. Tun.PSC04-5.I4 TaxID=1798213 RepID=UPI000ACBB709|nr:hypothetical protein [Pseudovibrio sp. Tun.PSC04-5.I4]
MNTRTVGQNGAKSLKEWGAIGRSRFALAGSSALSLVLMTTSAQATDIVIVDGQTVGQQVLGDGDRLVVNSGGTVTEASDGVRAGLSDRITIVNGGKITSTGEDGIDVGTATLTLENTGAILGKTYGIKADELANLTNSGTITGTDHSGINANIITNLTNSGTISGRLDGIKATTITKLTNTGTIKANSDNAIDATTITNLNNSGTISSDYDAVTATTITNLTNTGTITATVGAGVWAITITNLSNSGTISGKDRAISAATITSLTNSGTISGAAGIRAKFGLEYLKNLAGGVIESTQTSAGTAGVRMGFGKIDNAGIISGFVGIQAKTAGDTTITNSGLIASNQGATGVAIELAGTGVDTINLNAGSVLTGTLNWVDGSDDTLNMGAGLNAIVYLSGNEPITTNFASPLNASTSTYRAQADFSSAAAMGTMLDDVAGGIGGVVRTRMDAARLLIEQRAAGSSVKKTVWASG